MGDLVELPFALSTSVGPVPLTTAQGAARFAVAAQPSFPTVPSLPQHDASLLAQALAGVEGARVAPPGLIELDGAPLDDAAALVEPLAGQEFASLRAVLELARGADGLLGVRVPLLGPVTVGLSLRSAGVPIGVAAELAARVVAARAAAALDAALSALPRGVVLVMLNEPGLVGAMHPTFPLAPGEIRVLLDPVVDALDRSTRRHRLLIGVHVPGRTDWATVIGSGVSVISAPADVGMVGWAELLADYLDRGGRVAWGAVPVDQPLGTSEELLWRRLTSTWCELVGEGLDPLQVRTRSFISPADGLAHFGLSQAERVLGLVDSLSTRSRRQAIGARLTLGA